MAAAVIRRLAHGTPSGRSLVGSEASFSRTTRYVARSNLWNLGGTSPFATCEKNEANAFAFSWSVVELRLRDLAVLTYKSSESPRTPAALPR